MFVNKLLMYLLLYSSNIYIHNQFDEENEEMIKMFGDD